MKLIFMGTPDFSVPILKALAERHDMLAVYTQPPRPAGRGKLSRPSPVEMQANALEIPVRHPASLRNAGALSDFTALRADLAVVVAYGLILPQAFLDAPHSGCFNIHASLLPRWRGAAPIQRAIMAGDSQTGISIMQMEAGLDTGPVLATQTVAIAAHDTTATLHDRLSVLGSRLILDVLDRLPALTSVPQGDDGVTYAAKIDKAEARVDWTRPARTVDRLIRGLSPFPGAWTMAGSERLKLLGSRIATGQGAPGQILNALTVACGDGAVEITRVQREGKRAGDPADILRGMVLPLSLT